MANEAPVNDGGGLYDSQGLVDTLLTDVNELTGLLASGRYVGYCSKIVEIVQKLGLLKEGIQNDLDSRDRQIEELKKKG